MSKELELEYKKHIENDIPDLWNRIEEALPPKNIEQVNSDEENLKDINSYEVNSSENSENKVVSFTNRKKLRIFTGVAVAGICCMISIPAFLMGIKSSTSSAPAADATRNDMMAATAFEEVAEEATAEENVTGVVATEEATREVAMGDMAMEEAEPAFDYTTDEVTETVTEPAVESTEEEKYADEGVVASNVRVYIQSIYEENNRTYANAEILEGAGENPVVGEVILLDISDFHDSFMAQDKLTVDIAIADSKGTEKGEKRYKYKLVAIKN